MSEEQGGANFGGILEAAQRMQQELGRVQEELARRSIEGSAGGGMVVAVVNGRQQLLSVRIEPDIVDPGDIEMLQDLVVAAVNQALTKAQEVAQQEISKITGGMMFQLPGMV